MERLEWLKWRRQGLGGSDMPAIMGTSEYKTALDIYNDKISVEEPKEKTSFVAERGQRFEGRILALYNMMNDRNFAPKLIEREDPAFARVSLDGADGDYILEIKTAGKADHAGVKAGILPEKYRAQVQWALFVSGAKRCFYLSYNDPDWNETVSTGNLEVIEVLPDKEYIGTLIEAATKFWECVQKKKPPLPSAKDYKTLRGVTQAAQKFKRLKLRIDELSEELETVKGDLIAAAEAVNHPLCEVSGVKIVQVSKMGNVDQKKVRAEFESRVTRLIAILDKHGLLPECFDLKPINDDDYRGKGSTYWKIGE